MKVPFLNLNRSHSEIRDELCTAFREVFDSGVFINGPKCVEFETMFARYCDTSHCVGVGNGLDALVLILKALGVSNGDEVIVPANTFIASWLAVSMCGATPIPVEPREDTYNIDHRLLKAAITAKTKVIMVVHLYGLPVDFEEIQIIANQHGIPIVEDAAQAHGALYKSRKVGSLGIAAAFSFYPGKNLGALGDGGAVTTNCSKLVEKVRLISNYGAVEKYEHVIKGQNSRLDELQAAFLIEKLKRLPIWNDRRAQVANQYFDGLREFKERLPLVPEGLKHVWHLFVIKTNNRERCFKQLAGLGVQCGIHYPKAPHVQGAYEELMPNASKFQITQRIHDSVLSLPCGPHMDQQEVDLVMESVSSVLASDL